LKIASFRTRKGDSFGAVVGDGLIDLSRRAGGKYETVLDALRDDALSSFVVGQGADFAIRDVTLLPPVTAPEKILCVGVNYANRNEEYKDGTDQPKYPSLFMRTPGSFVGHDVPLQRPNESEQFDYEGEIVLVIGKAGRRISRADALSHVAGVTLCNEGSVRDWLRHGKFNVTQGKNFDASGSLGPWMVTADEIDFTKPLHVKTRVNGELRQNDTTYNLIFPFDYLISYISTFTALKPGDLIATGTPAGAGGRFDPPKWLKAGDLVEVEVPRIGLLSNRVIDEPK
jgi:2-keto-4-pentenoate hydratase/2-oxohepta-3-ene-1,7-dioic acid hydratase in catechol pathway